MLVCGGLQYSCGSQTNDDLGSGRHVEEVRIQTRWTRFHAHLCGRDSQVIPGLAGYSGKPSTKFPARQNPKCQDNFWAQVRDFTGRELAYRLPC